VPSCSSCTTRASVSPAAGKRPPGSPTCPPRSVRPRSSAPTTCWHWAYSRR
jgi:hypothetical protein